MTSVHKFRTGLAITSFFVTLNTLFFYGFVRDGTWLVIAILLIPVYRKGGVINFFTGSMSFLAATLLLIWIIDYGFPHFFYTKPYDWLITKDSDGFPVYKKNKVVEMKQLHGDLKAFAGDKEGLLEYEPRDIRFVTDSMGFRNDSDYSGQSFVLVGDSFVAGSGVSQEHTLSSILKKEHKVDTYNLGVASAGFSDYLHNIEKLQHKTKSAFKVLLFVYEGNDFINLDPPKKKSLSTLKRLQNIYRTPLKKYKSFFKETGLYRYTYNAYRSITHQFKGGNGKSLISVSEIGGHKIGFHNYHISQNSGIPKEVINKLRLIKTRVAHIYFIPTKYRTYHSLGASKMPNTQWETMQSLGNDLGVPVTDLTPALVDSAKKKLITGRFLFWKDDTHWNVLGIKTAAQVVCKTVREINCVNQLEAVDPQ